MYSGEVLQRGMLGPMSSIVMGVVILGEPFTPWIAAGTLLCWRCLAASEMALMNEGYREGALDMDLGIAGKWATVCAASKGLGKGCAKALAAEGVNVVITASGAEALNATADELR